MILPDCFGSWTSHAALGLIHDHFFCKPGAVGIECDRGRSRSSMSAAVSPACSGIAIGVTGRGSFFICATRSVQVAISSLSFSLSSSGMR